MSRASKVLRSVATMKCRYRYAANWFCLAMNFVIIATSLLTTATMAFAQVDKSGFEKLPRKVIGVLVFDNAELIARESRSGPPDAVVFVRDYRAFRWMYLPAPNDSDADDLPFRVLDDSKPVVFDDVRIATKSMLSKHDIVGPFNLVEVEVNGGRGSAPEEGFVATSIRRLDGTPDFPFSIPELISLMKKELSSHAESQASNIQKEFNEVRDKVANGRQSSLPNESDVDIFVTWLADERRLRVELISKVMNGFYVQGEGASNPVAKKPTRAGTQFGVKGGVRIDVEMRENKRVTTAIPYKGFTRELQLPR